MSSSLPNHDAKVGKDRQKRDKEEEKITKKTQGQTASDKVRAKTILKIQTIWCMNIINTWCML